MEELNPSQTERIELEGGMFPGTKAVGTAPEIIGSTYKKDLVLGLARLDQKAADYPAFTNASAPLRAVMHPGDGENINNRSITFEGNKAPLTDLQQYPDGVSEVKFASWYPFEQTLPDGQVVNTYNDSGKFVEAVIDGKTDVLYGSISSGSQPKGMTPIWFEHGLVQFNFYTYAIVDEKNTQELVNKIWGSLKDIKIINAATKCRLTLPGIRVEEDGKLISKDGDYTRQYLDYTGMIPVNKTGDYLLEQINAGLTNKTSLPAVIAAPPKNNVLEIEITTEIQGQGTKKSMTKGLTIARNFKPGRSYDIFLKFSDHGIINAEVSIGKWQDAGWIENETINNDIYYDLSAAENANCYIITSANYNYCFDVNYIGNGPNGIIDGTSAEISPNYIEIIWMDECMKPYVELENQSPIQNRAMLKITNDDTTKKDKKLKAEGNVLIGAWDQKGGTLLWTWHIWLTDKPLEQPYKNGFVVLDRDLGAVAPDIDTGENGFDEAATEDEIEIIAKNKRLLKEIDGLYYQWGRPTPLPLGRTTYDPRTEATAQDRSFKIAPNSADDDLMTRIGKPESFYTSELSRIHPQFNELWGLDLQNMRYRKTIYDPCPPGYRMPSRDLFHHINEHSIVFNTIHQHTFDATIQSYYELAHPLSGYWASPEKCTGYFDRYTEFIPETPQKQKEGAYLWTATVNFDDPHISVPYALDCRLKAAGKDDPVTKAGPTPTPVIGLGGEALHNPCDALPVRCVSVLSRPATIDLSAYQTANSYMVHRSGTYKFKATVRGNGIAHLVSAGTNGSIDISQGLNTDISNEIVKVEPLWWQGALGSIWGNYNPNDADTPIPVELINGGQLTKDGYCFFKVKANTLSEFQKGNLILAGKNIRGEILWTWHIWLTHEPETHKSYDYAVMDRFLGACADPTEKNIKDATIVPATFGLYYQFGRKDPFPGPSNCTEQQPQGSTWWQYVPNPSDGKTHWIPKNGLEQLTDQNLRTIPYSISHPTAYFIPLNGTGNWFDTNISIQGLDRVINNMDKQENQCFYQVINRGNLWGFSSAEGGIGKTTTKTMYDPCPPGYSVAYYLMWTQFATETTEGSGENRPIFSYKDAGDINATKQGIVTPFTYGMRLNRADFDKTWYPYTGYISVRSNELIYDEVGIQGTFQTSVPGGLGGRTLYYFNDNGTIHTGQAVSSKWKGIPSCYGFPVRCQKN